MRNDAKKKKIPTTSLNRKTKQARLGLAHEGFCIKIRGLGLFLKFNSIEISFVRALLSGTSLKLAVYIFLRFNHKCIVFRFFRKLVLLVYARCLLNFITLGKLDFQFT